MNRATVWGSPRGQTVTEKRWPADARDSQTWLVGGEEAQLLAYQSHVKREGLLPFGGYATPTQQKRGQKARDAVWKLPAWAVGLRLVLGDASPPDAVGWWWTDGKKLAEALRGMPAGPSRVRTAAAVCVAIGMASAANPLACPVQTAWPLVRAARWR